MYDEPEFDDPYRKRVSDSFPTGGVAGPIDTSAAFAPPTAGGSGGGGYDLEAFRKRWMQSGNVNDPSAWLSGNQDITSGVTLKNEKAYDPSGKFIADLVGNYSGGDPSQRSRIFLDGIGSNGLPRTASTATGAGTGKSGTVAPAANPFLTQIRQLITDRLKTLKGTPSIDDPELAAQSQAYRRSEQRSTDDERAMIAERAAQNGLLQGGQSSGGFDTDLRSLKEASGERSAAFDAGLVGDEIQYRRAEMQSLLNMALDSGDAESARSLSKELALLDAQLRREGLAQSGRQFDANLAQDRYMYDDTMGYRQGRDAEADYRWRYEQGYGG